MDLTECLVNMLAPLFLEYAFEEIDVDQDVRQCVLIEHRHARAGDEVLSPLSILSSQTSTPGNDKWTHQKTVRDVSDRNPICLVLVRILHDERVDDSAQPMRKLEQVHARPVLPRFGRPVIICQLEEVVQLRRDHRRDARRRTLRRLRERRPRCKPDRASTLRGPEARERLLELCAGDLEVLEVGDDLCDLGERGGCGELGLDGGADVVDEKAVERLAEELVDIPVVLRDAVHEEVESLDEVPDLMQTISGLQGENR